MESNEIVTAISAPGKVLLAGGYLILSPAYEGLVLAVDARIYTLVKCATLTGAADSLDHGTVVCVTSPQFVNCVSTFRLFDDGEIVRVVHDATTSPNFFVEQACHFVFNYMKAISPPAERLPRMHIELNVLAANAFYSQNPEIPRAELPAFNKLNIPITQVNKTGLGSSAALATSITTALFKALNPHVDLRRDIERLHNLSQLVHCAGQGGVSSGFDVAAACFGSCKYQRFSPKLAQNLETEPARYLARLIQQVHRRWDCNVDPFTLPIGLQLLLISVKGGTSTPKMTATFVNWARKYVWAALSYFADIRKAATSIEEQLAEIQKIPVTSRQWQRHLELARKRVYEPPFSRLRSAIEALRVLLESLTVRTGVPIVPSEYSGLTSRLYEIPGVLGVNAPGAGGYDAIYCIAFKDDMVIPSIDSMLAQLNTFKMYKEAGREFSLIPVEVCDDGIRLENYLELAPFL